MKPELINLLDRLKAHDPTFHSLVIHPTGRALATYQHGCVPFHDLDHLEQFCYPEPPKNVGDDVRSLTSPNP